jgi:hypothetical protein
MAAARGRGGGGAGNWAPLAARARRAPRGRRCRRRAGVLSTAAPRQEVRLDARIAQEARERVFGGGRSWTRVLRERGALERARRGLAERPERRGHPQQ